MAPVWKIVWLLLIAGLGGCATSDFGPDTVVKEATGIPERFIFAGTLGTAGVTGCRNPLTDPRDGTQIILVRSHDSMGDYRVPAGRYGVGQGELLRLDCATGSVLGIVRE